MKRRADNERKAVAATIDGDEQTTLMEHVRTPEMNDGEMRTNAKDVDGSRCGGPYTLLLLTVDDDGKQEESEKISSEASLLQRHTSE